VFTGIVEELGRVTEVTETATGDQAALRVGIEAPLVAADVAVGDSVSVSGVCLTVVDVSGSWFSADVMRETLTRSILRTAAPGTAVNLERALTLRSRLGGHLVQGHVDGTGRIAQRDHTPQWDVVRFTLPRTLARYVVAKGSIAIDGVSLTVVDAGEDTFSVSLIPTTLQRTTLGAKGVGDEVNLEVDVMAKYAERLLAAQLDDRVG
jgi:riboflavin synthase